MTAAARDRVRLPAQRGGWWHDHVCPVHGVELDHGDLLGGRFPDGGARCRHGCAVDTPAVRGAWYVLAHQALARHIRLLAHTGEHAAAADLLTGYAERYRDLVAGEHEQAAAWMLRGRLFHQALTEAIWAVSVGHAAHTLAEARVDVPGALPLLDALADAAATARASLVDSGRLTSNYAAWLNAAGAVTSRAAALLRGEPWTGRDWLDGEHGLYAHLLAATGPDGWEWEASTYYHGFVLRAALLALRGEEPARVPAAVRARLVAMVGVLAGIATEGGVLPALHDGPYARPALALEWLELAALADRFTTHAGLGAVAALAREQAGAADDGLDRVLGTWFTGPPLPGSPPRRPVVTRFPDAGYVVLRAPGIHAVADHGAHGGSHGHLDKLALYLYGARAPWQPDPGQVPYGHRPLRAHYASTAAHPAFTVDGLAQRESTGRCLHVARDRVLLAADGAFPGVRARRALVVHGPYLVDVLLLAADRPRALTVHLRPNCPLELHADGHSVWHATEILYGAHTCTVPANPTCHPGRGPADDPQRVRTWVDWTATAARAVFCSVYRAGAAVPAVTVTDGAAVRIGTETVTVHMGGDEDAQ